MSLSELTEVVGFPKSTLHHILNTLLPYDYVAQDTGSKKYRLGYKFLSLGKIILDHLDVRRIAHSSLRVLQEKTRESVHLAILRNGRVTYIDKIGQPAGLSLATYIGFATDPHAAAGGKVLLSELSEREILEIYRGRELKHYGKNTVTSFEQLFAHLENIRKQGYAVDDEEYYEGVRCVAAPIRGGGKIIASISITGSIFSMNMERIHNELIGQVVQTAQKISSQMMW